MTMLKHCQHQTVLICPANHPYILKHFRHNYSINLILTLNVSKVHFIYTVMLLKVIKNILVLQVFVMVNCLKIYFNKFLSIQLKFKHLIIFFFLLCTDQRKKLVRLFIFKITNYCLRSPHSSST